MAKKILISAGETSGDLHAARLIQEIQKLDDSIEFYGIGGDKMISNGFHALYHCNQMAFLGFSEVVRHLPFIAKVKKDIVNFAAKENISTAVMVDYPGFNLNLSASLKKSGSSLIYYISPQIWAWRKGRIDKIRSRVDKMLTILPFEEKIYKDANVPVEFVGHPLVEEIESYKFITKEELYSKYSLDASKEILLVLPGSRKQEIERIFPAIKAGILKVAAKFNLQPVVVCPSSLQNSLNSFLGDSEIKVVNDNNYDFMKYSRFGIIKSGTSTLEAGLLGLPMIVVYKTSNLTYTLGKKLISIDKIALVNIVLEKMLAPELIQSDLNEDKIYSSAAVYLENNSAYDNFKNELGKLSEILGKSNAAKRSAEIIIGYLNEHQNN